MFTEIDFIHSITYFVKLPRGFPPNLQKYIPIILYIPIRRVGGEGEEGGQPISESSSLDISTQAQDLILKSCHFLFLFLFSPFCIIWFHGQIPLSPWATSGALLPPTNTFNQPEKLNIVLSSSQSFFLSLPTISSEQYTTQVPLPPPAPLPLTKREMIISRSYPAYLHLLGKYNFVSTCTCTCPKRSSSGPWLKLDGVGRANGFSNRSYVRWGEPIDSLRTKQQVQ